MLSEIRMGWSGGIKIGGSLREFNNRYAEQGEALSDGSLRIGALVRVALTALEATIHIEGPAGERDVPIGEFFTLPGDTPHRETVLEPGELITFVNCRQPLPETNQSI
jgi:CO/xanthine dehydrogenase FAD-binding subunit